MSRLLSRRAIDLREAILHDDAISPSKKLGTWRAAVTEEHQEPALAVQEWIEGQLDTVTVDDVVRRMLLCPSVIVTCEEEADIPNEFRRRGLPDERYRKTGIELVLVEQGTARFFENHLRSGRSNRRGRYYVEPLAFEV
jgi:hypothetical protein